MKNSLFRNTLVAKQHAIRMLVGIAAIFGFCDFPQTSHKNISRVLKSYMEIYLLTPQAKFNLGTDELLQLLKPLYGLSENGDYWGRTFRGLLGTDLGTNSCISDAALFYKRLGKTLEGFCATYVDDALHAGSKDYQTSAKNTEQKFMCKERE